MEPAPQSQSHSSAWGTRRVALWGSILLALTCGLLLRIWFFRNVFEVNGDSLIYGDIARNLLLHGRYALTGATNLPHSTLIRLPGYPLYLAACFRVFGIENYALATWVQIALDLAACLLIADVGRRLAPARHQAFAGHIALWLAALCPFTAVYAATPLTEGPTVFSIALAFWAALRFLNQPRWFFALSFTFGILWAALLRPDGALLAVAFVPALLWLLRHVRSPRTLRIATVCAFLFAAPFVAWTWRNASVFHVFQPLVPQSATDPGSPVNPGWERWVKTWSLDFVTTYSIYWEVPGDQFDFSQLPNRAFDSPAQRAQTEALAASYNNNGFHLTPQLDARFAQLAADRIAAHPLRYYLGLPLGRVADMWLRPRVDNLNIDLDWWVYSNHNSETCFSWFYTALNALYLALGFAGLCMRPRLWPAILAYFLLRSALLATVAAPETRYTLECFPMLFVLGGLAIARMAAALRPAP